MNYLVNKKKYKLDLIMEENKHFNYFQKNKIKLVKCNSQGLLECSKKKNYNQILKKQVSYTNLVDKRKNNNSWKTQSYDGIKIQKKKINKSVIYLFITI